MVSKPENLGTKKHTRKFSKGFFFSETQEQEYIDSHQEEYIRDVLSRRNKNYNHVNSQYRSTHSAHSIPPIRNVFSIHSRVSVTISRPYHWNKKDLK